MTNLKWKFRLVIIGRKIPSNQFLGVNQERGKKHTVIRKPGRPKECRGEPSSLLQTKFTSVSYL